MSGDVQGDNLSADVGGDISGTGNIANSKDVTSNASENNQRNHVNVSIQNRDRLELIDYKLTRLNDNFEYRVSRLEDQIGGRLRNLERDIEQMRRDLDQAKNDGSKTREDVDELKQQSILVKFSPTATPTPVVPNGNLKRLFWAMVGFGFILTILISVLIVILARGYR